MDTNLFSIKESLTFGWKTFIKNWQFLVLLFVIIILAIMIPSWLHDWSRENLPTTSFLFSIIGWLVQMVTSIGVIVVSLKFVDNNKPEIADIYKHYNLLLNFFLGSLLYNFVVGLGFILLIIPGIIWAIKYQYTIYLIVDKQMRPFEAFKKSGEITKGVKIKLFWLGIVYYGLILLGFITLGIGLLIVLPVILISQAYVYRKLSSK